MHPQHISKGRRDRLVVAFVGAACTCALAVVSSAASAARISLSTPPGRVGVNSHLVWISEQEARPQLEQARAVGVAWVREEFPWRIVQPSPDGFSWRNTDGLMAAAARAEVNVLGILGYSAHWAASGPSSVYPPRDVADYARYAAAVVSRYGPGGSFWGGRPDLPARALGAVELWNEPWGHWNWKPNPDPAAYARLARAAASAIRRANPRVKILLAGDVLQARTDGKIVDWLANVLAADPRLPSLIDAYAVHPYPDPKTRGPYDERREQGYRWDFRRVLLTRELTVARNVARPIWITEIGWSTATAHPDGVSEQQQATFVRQAIGRALGEWGSFVERIFLYQWDPSSGIMSDREGNFGLRQADGSPKAALHGLAAVLGAEGRLSASRSPSSHGEHGALALSSRRAHLRGTGPARLPRWFWTWKSWRLGHGTFQRPAAADPHQRPRSVPTEIPAWAWTRIRPRRASAPIVIRGRVLARSLSAHREVRWAAKHDRRAVTVYRLTRRGWTRLAKVTTTTGGRFSTRARMPTQRRPLLMKAVARYRFLSVHSPVVQVRL